jgi:putative ABC transport system permease protein
MSRLTSWRLALRLARRDALRHRGRSVLVLVMIALPVLAVTAADVIISTQSVSGVEGLDRRIGSADARLEVPAEGAPMLQAFDPFDGTTSTGDGRHVPTAEDLSDALGGARLVQERESDLLLRTGDGVTYAQGTEVDLRDPMTTGLFDLTSGRWPATDDEVVVNQAVLDRGYAVGDRLDLVLDDAPSPTIVGVAESAEVRGFPVAAGPLDSLGLGDRLAGYGAGPAYLAAGGPVSWSTVKELNAMGAIVLSRAVITDPPPESEIPEEIRSWSGGTDNAMVAVVVLIVVMALLEVVLLAGPAFAVTARRQARTLALMAAAGGTPAQSRRVIVGGGVVIGFAAAVLGVLLGIGVGWALVPVVQARSDEWFGPFDVPWLHLLGITLFGLVSAVLATVVPAWIASRQDVVAVLAGRRADKRPSLRSPILGVVLLGAGVAGSAYGATAGQDGEFAIAASAVVAVLGMILLVPVIVVALARLAGRLPLSPRYATRDAARHRTRTVPAVAAVAATVAGVVALGIGITSDEAENEGTYQAALPMGDGAVTAPGLTDQQWTGLERTVAGKLPGAHVTPVVGVPESSSLEDPGSRSYYVEANVAGQRGTPLLDSWGSSYGSSVLVGDRLPSIVQGISLGDRDRADAALATGRAVVFTDHPVDADEVVLRASWWTSGSNENGRSPAASVPAVFVPYTGQERVATMVLPRDVLRQVDVPSSTVALAVSGVDVSVDQEQVVGDAARALASDGGFYVERGYQADDATVIVQLVLAGLGGVLMLGGTLTATFLALSDARPDLATLASVGASPRRRRSIAASYALVLGFVGAVLGALVGFIPGIAVTYPLTRGYSETAAHYVDVPWLMILGIVVALPLVTAAVVGLCTRARLPVVARVD